MASNNRRGPLYSHGWDEREKQYRRDYETGWGSAQNNFLRENNRDRGGFTGTPGSNYGAAAFGGSSQGPGFDEDKYRGYYGGGSRAAGFANSYTHSYGRDDYRRAGEQRDLRDEDYGTYRENQYARDRREDYGRAGHALGRPGSEWLREEGPHRGKGPKNYRRSDNRIREDVSDRLSDDPYVDASDIDITVEDGNVVLNGRVNSREAKRRAAYLAESIRGVANVENRLRTGQGLVENVAHAFTAAIGDVTLGSDVSTVEEPTGRKGRKRKSP